jgi:hypothetical protein
MAASVLHHVDTDRPEKPRFDRAAAAWVVALTVLSVVCVVRAEIDASCSRCAKWVKLSDEGAGFDRSWEGLCAACQDPERRCDEALKDLEARIEEYRDQLGYWKGILADAMRRKEAGEASFPGWPGFSMDEFIEQVNANVAGLENALANLRSMWADMKAECGGSAAPPGAEGGSSGASGEGGGTGGGGSGGGGSGGGGGLSGTADTNTQELLDALQKELERLRKLLEEQKESGSAPFYLVGFPSGNAPAEAAYLDAVMGGMKPVAALADGAPSAAERTAKPREAPSASQGDVIKPALVDVRADLPKAPVAKEFALWQRHTANAAACADALLGSIGQIDAATAAADPKRAHEHLERAAYLATRGQTELRQAEAMRAQGIRTLYGACNSFEGQAKGQGKTAEEALAAWQAEVRANGLPPDYVAALQKAGVPEEEIAKRREWLQSVDPKDAARTHTRFVRLVAPLYVPEARGVGNKPPAPKGGDLWDLVTIQLLRSQGAVKPEQPAAGGR